MVGGPKRCEGFVAIWLRTCEDIADNCFQLLFINIDDVGAPPPHSHTRGMSAGSKVSQCLASLYTQWEASCREASQHPPPFRSSYSALLACRYVSMLLFKSLLIL